MFAVRRAVPIVIGWIALAVALVVIANSVGRPTNNDLTLPGTGSTEAQNVLDDDLPDQANGSVPIVIETKTGTLASGKNKQVVEDTYKSLKKNQYVQDALSPYSSQGAADITKDGKIAYISVALDVSSGDLDDSQANSVLDAAEPARSTAGLEVSAGSYLGQELSSPSTRMSEIIGIVGALIILLFAFRTFTAAPLPVTTAVVALIAGLAVVGLEGHAFNVPTIAPTLAIMLGLAVGTDYSLFIISRHLLLMNEKGIPPEESIPRSMSSSGSAVVFAGTTVILALLCLYFSGIPLVRSLGYATAIVVAVAVLAAITLLPAILGLLGERVKHPAFRFLARAKEDVPKKGFPRLAGRLRAHPLIASLLGIVVLVVLALPMLDLRLGAPDDGQLPKDTTKRQAYDALTKGFGVGVNGPLLVAVKLNPVAKPDTKQLDQVEQQQAAQQQQAEEAQQQAAAAGEPPPQPTAKQQQQQDEATQQEAYLKTPASDPRLQSLESEIGKQNDVASVSQAQTDKSGNAAVFAVTPKTSPSAFATQDLVNHLRDETIPDSTKGTGMTAYVGGTTAGYIDLADKIGEKLPLVIFIVVALSCLLLTIVFRTVVIPLTSALLNLLAIVAAYGILTAVFQKGWGVELIGLDGPEPVVSYVPLMMFAILFGLSMDYQVFLVLRIAELHQGGERNSEAVSVGLARTGHVVFAAATIMFSVFFSFVLNGDPIVKQFGVGLAVSVAIDAFVVLLIVPAIMELLGERNWYMPKWLDRVLPNLRVEGDETLSHDTAPR